MKLYAKVLEWTLHISVCALIWVLLPEDSLLAFFVLCFISALLADTTARWALNKEQSSVLRTVLRIYVHNLEEGHRYTMLKDPGISAKEMQRRADKHPDPEKCIEIYRVETVGIQIFGKRFIWNRTPKND